MIKEQKYNGKVELVIIDSGSTDGTPELAESYEAKVKRIKKEEFNHSRTRTDAVSLTSFDKIIFMVQDALPVSNHWVEDLVNSLDNKDVVGAYGQQLPHDDADIYARFEVDFHSSYLGQEAVLQIIDSIEKFKKLPYEEALKTVRFDNVCAIYRKKVLEEIPFPEVDFAEDMAWAYAAMSRGYKILYQPKVKVRHSHNRTPEYRFRRAIVDTVFCSEILGKVKDDLSFLTYPDLLDISKTMENIIYQVNQSLYSSNNKQKSNKIGLNRSLVKNYFPILKQFFWTSLKVIPQTPRRKAWKYAYLEAAERHIKYVLGLIKEWYPEASDSDLMLCTEHLAASMQGSLFGGVYASNKLLGKIPHDIEELVRPNMKGV